MSEDASKELAIDVFKFLITKGELETQTILVALAQVLATVAVEAGMEEEKAVYAFRKSYRLAERRLKKVLKDIH